MGGQREQVLDPPRSQPKGKTKLLTPSGNKVRIHENKGEVHFHDDTARKKCAVDVADFAAAYDKFIGSGVVEEGKQLRLTDKAGKTTVVLTLIIGDELDVDIAVEDVKYGPNLAKLRRFMQV